MIVQIVECQHHYPPDEADSVLKLSSLHRAVLLLPRLYFYFEMIRTIPFLHQDDLLPIKIVILIMVAAAIPL